MSTNKIEIISYSSLYPELLFKEDGLRSLNFDVTTVLKEKKLLKFLSKQDQIALKVADEAWSMSGLPRENNLDTGIYFCIGILPFEDGPLHKIATLSQNDLGNFDVKRFSTDAYSSMNPLLTFKCLPNMPLYHISSHLQIKGRYFACYPGLYELFTAIEKAFEDLEDNLITHALIGAAADQENRLTKHHLGRLLPNLPSKAIDSGAVTIFSTDTSKKSLGTIHQVEINYRPFDPFQESLNFIPSNSYYDCFLGATEPLIVINNLISKRDRGIHKLKWTYPNGSNFSIDLEVK